MRCLQDTARVVLALWLALAPVKAWAGNQALLGAGSVGGGSTPFSIAAQTPVTTNSGASGVNTFNTVAIGAADATRIVGLTVCHGPNPATLSVFTIGGVSATQATGSVFNSGGGVQCEGWYAPVPTGATATIQFTASAADTRYVIGVYRIVGTGVSFSVAGGQNNASTSTASASVVIPAGGGAIAGVMTHSASSGSGTPTNLTLDTNNVAVGTSTSYIGNNTTGSGSTTMGVTWTGNADNALTIMAFNP